MIYCGVEQLVARRAHNPKVIGSSPVPATKKSQSLMTGFLHLKKCWKLAFKSGFGMQK